MKSEEYLNNYNDGGEFLTVVEKLAQDLQGEVHDEVISIIAGRYATLDLLDHAIHSCSHDDQRTGPGR